MSENEGLKTVMLDEIAEVQKTLAKPDVSIQDIAKALSFFIRVNMPAIESNFVTEKEQESRLEKFRGDCPVHAQYVKDQKLLNDIPLFKLFKLASRQIGWIFGIVVIIIVWLQRTGLIHFGK